MPTRDSYPEGTPSWVDLATPDIAGAEKFYSSLFPWEFVDVGNDETPYAMANKEGRTVAGIGSIADENVPSVWTTYFAVDDASGTAEKIKEAGGQILVGPMDAMGTGTFAIAAAPGGEVFGIWEANTHIGSGVVNEHGAVSWNELMTDDVDAALKFYHDVFGHITRTADMGGGFMYSTLGVGDRQIAGVMEKPDPDIPNSWGVYFAVDDAAAALEALKAGGGEVAWGPQETEGVGIMGGGADPYGAYFNVMQSDNLQD
ncbi:MAG: VOC family protein [Actinobacteria bacterium]|nr:MAG: VOC family protein [Actinomycetota bacterium]